ncbi:MAG: thiosulfate oxidation carrier protein SoxY [Rhodospirillales bacterium]|nr:thiosulfate oxidation carrier protein SoxY [Rhodospirillales bacterium]
MSKNDRPALSRRQLLVAAGSGMLMAAGVAAAPRAAHAGPAEADEAVKKLIGGASIKEGRVNLKLPQIAENGNTVPFTVSVDSPMTESDYVKSVYIISEGNPFPHVATFNFTPASGKAEVSMRMRMAKTQYVRAVATMSDGSVYQAKQEVKVTIGGCGG